MEAKGIAIQINENGWSLKNAEALIIEHTNSKLNKIIEEVRSQKETFAHEESDEEIWNDGLDRAITIIKKEITKKD